MWPWFILVVILIIGVLIIGFSLLMILVSLFEKHRIRQLEPVPPESLSSPSPYFLAMDKAAAQRPLTHCGYFAHVPKTSLKDAYMSAWLSPGKSILTCILGGRIAKVDYRKTLLISWVAPEKFLVTRDDFGEADHSNILDIEVLKNADLGELITRHSERLAKLSTPPKPFEPHEVLTIWEQMEGLRVQKLISMGLARWQDEAGGVWLYTLSGGWRNIIETFRSVKAARQQEERFDRKRVGS